MLCTIRYIDAREFLNFDENYTEEDWITRRRRLLLIGEMMIRFYVNSCRSKNYNFTCAVDSFLRISFYHFSLIQLFFEKFLREILISLSLIV